MSLQIETSSSLSLEDKEIISYGGMSKVYKALDSDSCYKVYKDRISAVIRNRIKDNMIHLSDTKYPSSIVLPEILYLDEENNLVGQKWDILMVQLDLQNFITNLPKIKLELSKQ